MIVKAEQHVAASSDEISLRDLIVIVRGIMQYLISQWLLIIVAIVLGSLIGYFYWRNSVPTYIAETTFVLEEEGSSSGMLGQLGGIAGMAGIDLGSGGGGLFQGDNIVQLYKSRSMIEKTLLSKVHGDGSNKLLIDYFIDFNGLQEKWAKEISPNGFQVSPPNREPNRKRDSLLAIAVKLINSQYLTVGKPDKKLSIISVKVTAKNEFFAKAFNDQIVRNVNDFYIQTKTKKSLENLSILQYQTDSVRRALSGSIVASAAAEDATPNLNSARQVLRAPAQRYLFNAEANKAILSQLVQNLELAKLSLRKETPLIQVVDQPIYPLVTDQVGRTRSIAIGGIIFGFIICLFLVISKFVKDAINSNGI